VNESMAAMASRWFLRNVSYRASFRPYRRWALQGLVLRRGSLGWEHPQNRQRVAPSRNFFSCSPNAIRGRTA
jgi:hypothetical protein